ncbi:27463_t:CDS:2 [Dentiscutata erythropus]|uniref:27463_t:CDS:1 n=1 Tax=Dentiscutata erythropus TaxID=1348616 RepID=A0A9N8ZU08_9GLOM|nr:27463_t:CDS:2 [Dentiscutata erythropus]
MSFYFVINNGEQKIKGLYDTIVKDPGVRFNIALDFNYKGTSFAARVEAPDKPDITYILKCNNTNEFNVKRNWNAITSRKLLNKFNGSKSYFDNICNPIEGRNQPVSFNSKF